MDIGQTKEYIMKFHFETNYDLRALTSMAKGLRKTVRSKESKRNHTMCIAMAVIMLVMVLVNGSAALEPTFWNVLNWIIIVVLILSVLFDDMVNAYLSQRRKVVGREKTAVVFSADKYQLITAKRSSTWYYTRIAALAEDKEFFVIVLNESNAQVFKKSTLKDASMDEFRTFIKQATGKEIVQM